VRLLIERRMSFIKGLFLFFIYFLLELNELNEQWIIYYALAFALAMDAFAVSISLGMAGLAKSWSSRIKIAISFGFFQGLYFLLGFLSLSFIDSTTSTFYQILASILLAYLGIKMFLEGFKKESGTCPHNVCLGLNCSNTKCDRTGQYRFLNLKLLFIYGTITSIDAYAAGISFQLKYDYSYEVTYLIAFITLILSFFGAMFGERLKDKIGKKSELIGGLILIMLAIKGLF
jgi:manganese efflux pump family protein